MYDEEEIDGIKQLANCLWATFIKRMSTGYLEKGTLPHLRIDDYIQLKLFIELVSKIKKES